MRFIALSVQIVDWTGVIVDVFWGEILPEQWRADSYIHFVYCTAVIYYLTE